MATPAVRRADSSCLANILRTDEKERELRRGVAKEEKKQIERQVKRTTEFVG